MALLGALFFGFVPMFLFAAFVNWLDRYEKEPKLLLGAAFLWGVIIAGGGAFILNTAFGIGVYAITGSEGAAEFGTTSIAAPIIEEALKGLAILAVFLMFRHEFDSVLDGVVYGAVTAMGFAAIENVLYIYRNGYLEGGWEGFWVLVVIRVVLVVMATERLASPPPASSRAWSHALGRRSLRGRYARGARPGWS